ncbi:MAG: hypothetical protein ACE5Z5_00775 [Candidatus Bathyarchaeia archaeon]
MFEQSEVVPITMLMQEEGISRKLGEAIAKALGPRRTRSWLPLQT